MFRRRLGDGVLSNQGSNSDPTRVFLDDGKDIHKRHAIYRLQSKDYLLEICLLALAIIVRFYRLGFPDCTVFDEVHFGRFISQYDFREYFFDIHPPLAKLCMYAFAKLFGFHAIDRDKFKFQTIGKQFPAELVWFPLRALPAFFGALCVPLMYRTCRKLGIGIEFSVVAAFFVCFDMCGVIESRLILTDSQLIFYCALALYLMLELWDTLPNTPRRRWLVFASGLACGACISVKFTGLATPGLTGLVCLFGLYFPLRGRISFMECVIIGAIGLSLFYASFGIHFSLLHKTGDGDGFMPGWFRMTLQGSAFQKSAKKPPSFFFFRSVGYIVFEMIRASARIKNKHNWQSSWWSWPLDIRGILYYTDPDHSEGLIAKIYLLGNPIVYWFVLLFVFLFVMSLPLLLVVRKVRKFRERFRFSVDAVRSYVCVGLFLFSGWALNLLPYLDVSRPTFLYHYLPGLWYGVLLSVWLLDQLPNRKALRLSVAITLCVATCLVYVYFAPWVYDLHVSKARQKSMQWLSKWN